MSYDEKTYAREMIRTDRNARRSVLGGVSGSDEPSVLVGEKKISRLWGMGGGR